MNPSGFGLTQSERCVVKKGEQSFGTRILIFCSSMESYSWGPFFKIGPGDSEVLPPNQTVEGGYQIFVFWEARDLNGEKSASNLVTLKPLLVFFCLISLFTLFWPIREKNKC